MTTRRRPSLAGLRDATLFLAGLGLTIHEAIAYMGPERWGLLMLYAGMMGLPAFLRSDEKREAQTPSPPTPPALPEPPTPPEGTTL